MDLGEKSFSATILLIDSDKEDRLAFHRVLKDSHINATITDIVDPELALKTIEEGVSLFDIVVIDYNLAGASGLELCKELLSYHASLPIVLMTEWNNEAAAIEAFKVGIDDCFIKGDKQRYSERLPYTLEGVIKKYRENRLRINAEEALFKIEHSLSNVRQTDTIGSWSWNLLMNETTWSHQIYRIFHFSQTNLRPLTKPF